MDLHFKLSVDDTNSLLNLLGQMPTASGAFGLWFDIRSQAERDFKSQSEPVTEPQVIAETSTVETPEITDPAMVM